MVYIICLINTLLFKMVVLFAPEINFNKHGSDLDLKKVCFFFKLMCIIHKIG